MRNKFEMPAAEYAGHNDTVNSVEVSRHSKFAVSGSKDNTAQMWVLKTLKQICIYTGHEDDVLTVAISPDEHYIASSGKDKSVQVWEALGDIGGVHFARRHKETVRSVAWSPTSQYLASGGDDTVVKVWDINGELLYTYKKHRSGITSVAWIGNNVVSVSSNQVDIWRAV
jgi:WD40 repeat protein